MKLAFNRWPLGINPQMDDAANRWGLSHWSCVSPQSNEWWVRQDGRQLHDDMLLAKESIPDLLRYYDEAYPMEVA